MTNDPTWVPGGNNDDQRAQDEAMRAARARLRPVAANLPASSRPEIVYLDPRADRAVSQYSPEGEIRMMGEFAAGLTRNGGVSRPMAYALVAIILLPILIGAIALLSTWL